MPPVRTIAVIESLVEAAESATRRGLSGHSFTMQATGRRAFKSDRLEELRKTVCDSHETGQDRVNELNRQIKAVEARRNNLDDSVEEGLPLDDTLNLRSDQLRTSREALLIEVANARHDRLLHRFCRT